jgi:hypothetical protein
MNMADVRYFKVLKDTSIPRAFRAVRDNSGTTYDYETEGVAYSAGEVVSSNNIDPRVVERFDDGDEHLNSLLEEVDASALDDYQEQVRAENELLRSPEHSVEAYALASDPEEPYTLLPSSEAVIEVDEEEAEQAKKQLEEAEAEVDPVEEEDALSAIDFAAVKGLADKEAGKSQPVTKLAQDGTFESPPEVPEEPGDSQGPSTESKPASEKKSTAKKSTANVSEVKDSDKDNKE